MILQELSLANFRRYSQKSITFVEGINLLHGPNASGKTTVLEAISLLATGKPFRSSRLANLINKDASAFHVRAEYQKDEMQQTLSFGYNGEDRRITHNGSLCTATSSLLGNLLGVIFTPDDIEIIKAGPSVRRRLLDLQIAQAVPLYVEHAVKFQRALLQRNQLLKERSDNSIAEWEHVMAETAAYICNQRRQIVALLQTESSAIFSELSNGRELLQLDYQTLTDLQNMSDITAFYKERLERTRHREMDVGYTLTGPQRDDLLITINGMDVRHFASEGQQRSCVAALRLAEWRLLKKRTGQSPLLLLDDIGISLDPLRQQYLYTFIQEIPQVLLTATEARCNQPLHAISF